MLMLIQFRVILKDQPEPSKIFKRFTFDEMKSALEKMVISRGCK